MKKFNNSKNKRRLLLANLRMMMKVILEKITQKLILKTELVLQQVAILVSFRLEK
jgi:hypothetical protein